MDKIIKNDDVFLLPCGHRSLNDSENLLWVYLLLIQFVLKCFERPFYKIFIDFIVLTLFVATRNDQAKFAT